MMEEARRTKGRGGGKAHTRRVSTSRTQKTLVLVGLHSLGVREVQIKGFRAKEGDGDNEKGVNKTGLEQAKRPVADVMGSQATSKDLEARQSVQ